MHLSPRTVETYRARVIEKLQFKDVVALVKFAIRNGMSTVDWRRAVAAVSDAVGHG
jgi:hypothetical protein